MKVILDACLEKMEANPGEQKSVAVHEEVPQEEAAVETFGAPKKRHGDWTLATIEERRFLWSAPRSLLRSGAVNKSLQQ
jgi:hypothetical protein